jgi:hypothetical protein
MQKAKFKKGDWCFCEFKLQQIMNTEENRITEVSDVMFRTSGYDISDRCFHLDLTIKRCSDTAAYWSKRFHELNNNSLNHPDLNRELISRWVAMCENKDNEKKLQELYDSLDKFGNAVVKKVNELKCEEVEGLSLFRR